MLIHPFNILAKTSFHNQAVHKGGGGSGSGSSHSTSTSTRELDPRFAGTVYQASDDLKAAYDSGELGKVAGVSSLQQEAFDAASGSSHTGIDSIIESRDTFRDMMNGEGMFDPVQTAELERAAIDQAAKERGVMNDEFAKAGLMGGSRAAIAAGDADAQLTNALAEVKYTQLNRQQDLALEGAQSLGASGTAEADLLTNNLRNLTDLGGLQRGIEQEQLDTTAKGLENYLTGINALAPLLSQEKTVQESTSNEQSSGGGK